jgi:preprotein translocase subunit SecA
MNLARMGSLSFIDQSWKNHLSEMDYLRSGIGLRAMGQRDPLVEYQKEGYDLFEDLIHNVKLSVVRLLLNFEKIAKDNSNLDKENKINAENEDKIDGYHLIKNFKFENFLQSQEFVNKVGEIAEKEGHHPDLWFGWGYARIKIFTHAIKGLAESDFILAAKIDKISNV